MRLRRRPSVTTVDARFGVGGMTPAKGETGVLGAFRGPPSRVREGERGGRRDDPAEGRSPGAVSGKARQPPAPASCACVTSAQVEDLYSAAAASTDRIEEFKQQC
jgi:hypothetical protein